MTVNVLFFSSISMLSNVKIYLIIFIYENEWFMFYNVPLFLDNSAFCITFIAFVFLILLLILSIFAN